MEAHLSTFNTKYTRSNSLRILETDLKYIMLDSKAAVRGRRKIIAGLNVMEGVCY